MLFKLNILLLVALFAIGTAAPVDTVNGAINDAAAAANGAANTATGAADGAVDMVNGATSGVFEFVNGTLIPVLEPQFDNGFTTATGAIEKVVNAANETIRAYLDSRRTIIGRSKGGPANKPVVVIYRLNPRFFDLIDDLLELNDRLKGTRFSIKN